MKHKLLSLVALSGAMLVSASAMAWDDPVRPTRPKVNQQYEGSFVEPEDGRQYYIYNVGAGLFLGGGQTWGTRAIVLCDSVIAVTEEAAINNVSGNTTANYVLPFELVGTGESGQYNINVLANSKATAGAGHFVGEDGAQAWIDGDDSRNASFGLWSITQYEGGYMITNDYATNTKYADAPRAYGVDGNNTAISWATTWTDLYLEKPEGNTTDPQLVWKFVSADDFDAVSAYSKAFKEAFNSEEFQAQIAAYDAAMAVYNKKLDLKSALEEAEAAGINTDAAGAVYTKVDATLEEVQDAITALRAALAAGSYDFGGASEDTPLDVTDMVLTNASFDGNMDGWTITVGGQNLQYQGRTDGQVDPSKNWVSITGFIEAWTPSPNTLGDGTISQTVYGLPAGKYMLECDAMATKQGDADPEGAVTGAYIFIASSNSETREPIKAPDTQPKHWSVVFVSDGSPALTFGLKVENTTANWISADNFRLWYYGATNRTPEQLALDQAIKDAEDIVLDEVRASKDTKEAFEAALVAAKGVQESTDAETLSAATTALKEALDAMRASISQYQAVGTFLTELGDMMEAADGNGWDTLSDALYDWQTEINEGYEQGTLTAEDIAGFSDELHNKIVEFLNTEGAITEGNDLTFLLVNPHFTTGSTANPTGWTINNGAMTELRASTHNIETYHAAFDISQTLPNMPVGVYDVTLQGFARHDDASVTDKTWLYGGITKAQLISLNDNVEQKRLEPIFSSETLEERPAMGDSNYDNSTATDEQGNTLYQANGMTGAYYWFQTENPNTSEPYYTNHVKVIMAQPGDLTVGIHCETTSDWVIFDNFQVKYLGVNAEVYAETIETMIDQLNKLAENENTYLTAAAQNLVETVPAKAQTVIDNADIDECIAMIEEIDAAITYIQAGNKLFDELFDLANNNIYERIMATPHSGADYEAIVTEAANCKENAASYADNDAVSAMTAKVKSGWVAYVMSDASDDNNEENPYDATDVIFNPDFELENANYWNINISGGTQGYQGAQYINTKEDGTEIVISKFVETWRGDGSLNDGNISQTLFGALPAGYYRLEMDGYATNQAGIPEEGVQGAYLYVQIGDARMLAPIGITEPSGLPEHFTLDFYSNGTDVPTLGLWIEGANCNWAAADNFKLYYIGQEAPDAVESLAAKTNSNAAIAIYGIDGRQQSQLRRGINIVRTADGTRKVMVK